MACFFSVTAQVTLLTSNTIVFDNLVIPPMANVTFIWGREGYPSSEGAIIPMPDGR